MQVTIRHVTCGVFIRVMNVLSHDESLKEIVTPQLQYAVLDAVFCVNALYIPTQII